MIITVATIFVIFLSGTMLSGWLLYKLTQVDLEPRDWTAKNIAP